MGWQSFFAGAWLLGLKSAAEQVSTAELKRILRLHLATLNRSGSHDTSKKSRSAPGPSDILPRVPYAKRPVFETASFIVSQTGSKKIYVKISCQ
jgi:hypothetical protein